MLPARATHTMLPASKVILETVLVMLERAMLLAGVADVQSLVEKASLGTVLLQMGRRAKVAVGAERRKSQSAAVRPHDQMGCCKAAAAVAAAAAAAAAAAERNTLTMQSSEVGKVHGYKFAARTAG